MNTSPDHSISSVSIVQRGFIDKVKPSWVCCAPFDLPLPPSQEQGSSFEEVIDHITFAYANANRHRDESRLGHLGQDVSDFGCFGGMRSRGFPILSGYSPSGVAFFGG